MVGKVKMEKKFELETLKKKPSYKKELVRLILQSLKENGYNKTLKTLEEESNVRFESEQTLELKRLVFQGNWDQVCTLVHVLLKDSICNIKEIEFLVYEEWFLELVAENRKRDALECLRKRIGPLEINRDRIKILSSILMAHKLNEKRNTENSRRLLLANIQKYFPPSIMFQDNRLEKIIEQSLAYQKRICFFHEFDTLPISLLEDHQCQNSALSFQPFKTLNGHKDEVWHISFSNNGKRLGSTSKDRTCIIWDVDRGCPIHILKDHTDTVCYSSWSPDDQFLLTCSNDKTVRVWRTIVSEGTCMLTITKHVRIVQTCAWLPEGNKFLTAGLDQKVYLWDLNEKIIKSWSGVRINDLKVSKDGKWMVAVCYEKKIRIYGLENDYETFIQESHYIVSLSLSENDRYALVSLQSEKIHLWDIKEKKHLKTYYGHKNGQYVIRNCFGGLNDRFVVSGSEDGHILVWHTESERLIQDLTAHTKSVNTVCWSPVNVNVFASASDDGTVRLWNLL